MSFSVPIRNRNYYYDNELNRFLDTLAVPADTFVGKFGDVDFKTTRAGTELICNDGFPDASVIFLNS